MKRILVVEDDTELLVGLKDNLELEGYEVITATDGEQGLNLALRAGPDVVVLDIMLPRLGGFEVCRLLKERGAGVPVLILTARAQESDKVLGLELGADDYVTKPFSLHELLARIRAILRRAAAPPPPRETYCLGDVELNFRHLVARKGRRLLKLSSLEFEVLRYLVAHSGEIVSRDQLLHEVWGHHGLLNTRSVDNLVGRLRHKLERNPHQPKHILTVHGTGYRLVD